MKSRDIVVVVFMQFVVVASLAAAETNSDTKRDLYARMRLRFFPELMDRIQVKSIQDEIQADLATRQRLNGLASELFFARSALFKEFASATTAELKEKERRMKELHEKCDAEFRGILSIDQIERVQQVYFQKRGSQTLREPEVIEWLELTIPQQRQIQSVHAERSQKIRALTDEWKKVNDKTTTTVAEFQDRKDQIEDERNRNAINVLTDDQRRKYDDLIGKPFTPPKR